MSKLVITDYSSAEGTRSFPVRQQPATDGIGAYQLPSTVSIHGSDTIRFGFRAEESSEESDGVYRSLKMLCAYPEGFYGDRTPLPSELDARDLATLFVGHLVQVGQEAASRYAARFDAEPSFGITLGVPMAQLDDETLQRRFVEIAREAFDLRSHIDLLHNDVTTAAASSALRAVRQAQGDTPISEPRDWVRSEAEAALFWAHSSPDIPPGRYSCVDVGAGTTSASWFHITANQENVKERLSFYGAACAPPGCDAIDADLAEALGLPTRAEVRGRETDILSRLPATGRGAIAPTLDEIANVYGAASTAAFKKEMSTKAWKEIGQVFFPGGGSKIEAVCQRLIKQKRDWLQPSAVAELEAPADLVEEDGEDLREDPTFLLVAYGLARRLADVPDTFRPIEVSDFQPAFPTRERNRHEDIYSR
ncbi:MAG: hypothetical protein F4Y86_13560 [Gammaproteobacteria bacterium]|nr:hypothetical protein [Gammaproteobacteria bacterium]